MPAPKAASPSFPRGFSDYLRKLTLGSPIQVIPKVRKGKPAHLLAAASLHRGAGLGGPDRRARDRAAPRHRALRPEAPQARADARSPEAIDGPAAQHAAREPRPGALRKHGAARRERADVPERRAGVPGGVGRGGGVHRRERAREGEKIYD